MRGAALSCFQPDATRCGRCLSRSLPRLMPHYSPVTQAEGVRLVVYWCPLSGICPHWDSFCFFSVHFVLCFFHLLPLCFGCLWCLAHTHACCIILSQLHCDPGFQWAGSAAVRFLTLTHRCFVGLWCPSAVRRDLRTLGECDASVCFSFAFSGIHLFPPFNLCCQTCF